MIERAAIAGRARARKRAADALLAGVPDAQLAKLEALLVPDPRLGTTPFAWLKAMPVAPKADHVRELLDRLRLVRGIGLPADTAGRVHEERLQQLVREGHASDAHQIGRYAARRRRAILVATIIDLEARLTDAVLDMADKLIGGLFAKARNAARRRYVASAGDVGRLMRLFHGTIEALAAAQESDRDAFEVVDETVGWPKLLRVRGEVADPGRSRRRRSAAPRRRPLEDTAQVRARPDRGAGVPGRTRATTRCWRPSGCSRDLNRSGKRDVPPDAPMPFRKEWRRLVQDGGQTNRRLYETAVLATLRDKLRSGDVWVERSSNYRRFDSYLLPQAAVPAAAAELGLPATADEWLAARGQELDRTAEALRAPAAAAASWKASSCATGACTWRPVKASAPPEARAFADGIDAMMPSCPHHRAAARGQPGDRLRGRLHQPAHRRALRRRERASRHRAGRRHQPRPTAAWRPPVTASPATS